ncbi:MAG: peptidylprolyl isomerase [Bacteroidales bacterium]|nr:peptidylprolyl isomerase [Bacteroidales bacterium]
MKKFFASVLLSVMAFCAVAQQAEDPVIFEINGKNIYKSEFMKEFLHSIGKDPAAAPTACTYEKRKALEDYVQLYINFQTKLADAYAMGLDTTKSLNNELKSYRKDLAAPYLIDSATLQNLLKEAYERNHYALHAAHILVPCPATASPEDTLKAFNHAVELCAKAMLGNDFYELAQQEMREQRLKDRDPLVREKANDINPMEGELGCFTVFDMVYPFESAAYLMKPGDISHPVRSRYGYHIIKLFDKYEYYGKSQVAHIWISEKDPSAKGKINSAYRQLQEGQNFGFVAKNTSDDRTTAKNGGLMPELPCNQLPYAYVETIAKGLKVGEYSEPFHTPFGWHIIKLVKKDTIPPFENLLPYYRTRMTRGERSTKPQHIFVEQCKQKYDFVDYTQVKTSKKKNAPYAASLDAVRSVISDSIFSAIFHYDSNQITDMRPLFKIGDQEYNSRQLARYIYKNKKVRPLSTLDIFLRDRYQEFISEKVLEYADKRLELDNPDFANLVQEYRHGLMIFSYNDHKVWSRAIKDTLGFAEFYKTASASHNYNDTNDSVYFWDERARVHTYYISDSTVLVPSKVVKIINKGLKKGWSSSEIADEFASKSKKGKVSWAEDIVLLEKGHQQTLSANEWRVGVYTHPGVGDFYFTALATDSIAPERAYTVLVVEHLLEPALKSCEEARGYYLNDYQNYLEEQNNAALRKKYNVKIYQDVIDEITY